MSTEYAFGKIVTNGLVLSLDAADVNSYTTASVTWNDLSGNGYNTTMSGSVAYSGSFPNSFQYLSGSNNYFSGSSDLTGSIVNGVTISSWIKINNTATRSIIFSKYNNTGIPGYDFEAGTATSLWTNTLRFYAAGTGFASGFATDYRGVSNAITQGSIFLATVTFDFATKITAMYVNGSAISATQTATPASIASDWYKSTVQYKMGSDRPAQTVDAAMNQYIVTVYNRALSAIEISQNYNAQKSRFGL
jgi:hypothetical protein